MIAKIFSAIPQGYDGSIVEVEGSTTKGLPGFNIVGMANKTISEARERVRAAIMSSGFSFPAQKLTINLAPAELSKDGSHLDLPIALAVLVLSKQLLQANLDGSFFVGELSLDGHTKPVRGIINIVETAKKAGFQTVFLPRDNLKQAKLISDINLVGIDTLTDLFLYLKGDKAASKNVVKNNYTDAKVTSPLPQNHSVVEKTATDSSNLYGSITLDQIEGQDFAKRALMIALAGHHNILFTGPPGSGKTLLAKSARSLLPPPTPEELIEIVKLHSLVNPPDFIMQQRPFRSPHHTSSSTAIIGGGPHVTPGEISLAHHGILLLDEFPEYSRNVIEALRQPLEDRIISISRADRHLCYPANFMLIATMNPCPCGYFGSPNHECTCTTSQIQNYRKRLSGPILDRFDLAIEVKPHSKNVVKNNKIGTEQTSRHGVVKNTQTDYQHNNVKNTLTVIQQRQNERYQELGLYNGTISPQLLQRHLRASPKAIAFCKTAAEQLNLSMRGYYKVLKIARTIADLEAKTEVEIEHISEALAFRLPKS